MCTLFFSSSRKTYLQCHITSLYCLCQVKVLLRIHRIHTIMSSDRMSPTLPQINPQPAAATPAPTCTHPAESACLCDVTRTPRLFPRSLCRANRPFWRCCNKEATSALSACVLFSLIWLSCLCHSCTIVCYFSCFFGNSELLGIQERAALSMWPLPVFDHWLSYRYLHDS